MHLDLKVATLGAAAMLAAASIAAILPVLLKSQPEERIVIEGSTVKLSDQQIESLKKELADVFENSKKKSEAERILTDFARSVCGSNANFASKVAVYIGKSKIVHITFQIPEGFESFSHADINVIECSARLTAYFAQKFDDINLK